jgi:starch phosphorylase
MPVAPENARSLDHEGERFFFCSELCKNAFAWNPGAYVRRARAMDGSEEPVRIIAYFSMEVAADPRMPTYSGGLGVLAGDTLRSSADLRIPAIAVTLVHRNGYFAQSLDGEGRQVERPERWAPESCLRPLPARVEVLIEGRSVQVRGWRYDVVGLGGWVIPLVLLDTDIAENAEPDRHLTDWLYGGDDRYRLAQEVVLDVGGVRMLRALGHTDIEKLHLNEGHATSLRSSSCGERSSPRAGTSMTSCGAASSRRTPPSRQGTTSSATTSCGRSRAISSRAMSSGCWAGRTA